MNFLIRLIDRLANLWGEWRYRQAVKALSKLPDFQPFDFEQIHYDKTGMSITGWHENLAEFCALAAELLDRQKAENYVQCVMLPRLKSGVKPVEVTFRWYYGGLTPAQKNARLDEENKKLILWREKALERHPDLADLN